MNAPDDFLYRKALLRLAADARGAGALDPADASATVHNPACGDRVTVSLRMAGGRVAALGHVTEACVLAQASASLLAEAAPGMDAAALATLADGVRAMLRGGENLPAYAAFEGAGAHAGRHRCVLLPIEAALKAVEGGG